MKMIFNMKTCLDFQVKINNQINSKTYIIIQKAPSALLFYLKFKLIYTFTNKSKKLIIFYILKILYGFY